MGNVFILPKPETTSLKNNVYKGGGVVGLGENNKGKRIQNIYIGENKYLIH
jgi:hypothetical protein